MKLRILSSDYNDLADGQDFYDREIEGLGEYFLDSLFSDVDSLVLYGGIHRKVFGFHRALSKRFPYAIYYQIETGNSLVIYRILDCRQNPKAIQKALKSTH